MDFILANLWLVSLVAAVIALGFVGLQAKRYWLRRKAPIS